MIGTLTFTYGHDRTELYQYKALDKLDKLFRNKLDYNLYIFHNTTDEFVTKIKQSNVFSDFNLTFAGIQGSYPYALKQALIHLKNKGITKIIFLQDDVFCLLHNEQEVLDLVELLKTTKMPYINLEYCYDTFKDKLDSSFALTSYKDYKIFNTDTTFFKNATTWSWSFDDSPYFSTLDFALNTIYDETYFSYPDIWSAEWYLKAKFDQQNISRPITNVSSFRRVNLIGKHANREEELKFLKTKFKN